MSIAKQLVDLDNRVHRVMDQLAATFTAEEQTMLLRRLVLQHADAQSIVNDCQLWLDIYGDAAQSEAAMEVQS